MANTLKDKTSGVGIVDDGYIVPQARATDGKVYKLTNIEYDRMYNGFTGHSGTGWDGRNQTLTLLANTIINLSTLRVSGTLRVLQDGTGGRTLTINGTAISINPAANSVTYISFINFGSVDLFVNVNAIPIIGGDATPPTILSAAAINATTIRVVFSESVTATNAGWSFKKNGSPLGISSVSGSGDTWNFVVGTISNGDTILRSYDSATGNTIDVSSNELVSFTDQPVTNTLGDTTAPTIVSAVAVDTTHIRIVFSESVNVTIAGWSFKKNGSALAVTSVAQINPTTWDFLVATMAAGNTILRSYNATTGNTVDLASNELAAFTDQGVTNSITGDTTPPSVVSLVIENATPTKLRVTYNEALDTAFIPTNSNYILNESSPGSGFTGSPVVGSNYVELTLATAATAGAGYDLGYTGTAVRDVAGNQAGGFTTATVTNNVAGGGGSSVDLIATGTAIIESPSRIWHCSINDVAFGHTAKDATHIVPAGQSGGVRFCIDALYDVREIFLGLNNANAEVGYDQMKCSMRMHDADLIEYGSYNGSNNVRTDYGTAVSNNWYRLYRDITAGNIRFQTSTNGTSWTDLVTLGYYSAGDLYPVFDFIGSDARFISNPKLDLA
jgi:hypothetical protein